MKKTVLLALAFLGLALSLGAEDKNVTKSPDGTKEAFTRDNDLWVRSLADSVETRLTFDGSDLILNGYASWVYYEEILGRASRYKAFWWSPDSQKIGFYRFDNSGVPMFPIYSPFGQDGSLSRTRYPKAGETNPLVKIGIINLADKSTTWADFAEDPEQYFGIPFWGKDSKEIYIAREPRRQNTLDLYAVSAESGKGRHVYHEEYPTWLDWIEGMVFTDRGLYMARSFETGWEQIYFLSYEGQLRRLTDGENWGVNILKVNEKTGDIWYTAKRDHKLHTTLYKVDRKGRIIALTDPEFNVSGVKISEDGKTFTAMISTARSPWAEIEGRTDKFQITSNKPLAEAPAGRRPMPQIVKIENDGFDLYGLMTLPKNFMPGKRYPVHVSLYGGPGTMNVRDSWSGGTGNWFYENGIINIAVDPRSSGENGRRGMDQAFGQMTVTELQDYIAWAKWLQAQPYVDGDRIGVQGFSFGGTTTSMLVLRYPQYFSCGVAGGGVYDWMLYDSHYTERYMDTPQANPDGYRKASVITYIPEIFAEDNYGLKPYPGALKLTHGTGDDNVHFQNTLQLIDALQRAGYQFELMIYPDGMHGYRGHQGRHDADHDSLFWTKNLLDRR